MILGYELKSIKNISSKSCLKKFDCGVEPLNTFLSSYAIKNDALGIGKTFVLENNERKIGGYFTLATSQVSFDNVPDEYKLKLPKYPIPAIRIARLAVSNDLKGKGIGKWLLSQAFMKILQVSEITGIYLIIVDAKETSKKFYEKYGFIKFRNEKLTYCLPVETVRKAIAE